MRKQIAAANWKMNLSLQQGLQLMDELLASNHSLSDNQQAIFAVPFPYLIPIREKLAGKERAFVAAQNCSDKNNGAFKLLPIKSCQFSSVIAPISVA